MGISKYNSEGYHDPTTYEALSKIEKEEKAAKRVYRPLVYICSPYAGDTKTNVNMARVYSRFAIRNACIPLVVFAAVDYITGVMCAVADRKLSSEVGFKGICRKVLIFILVGIANILDVQVIGTGSVLRTAVIFFYLSNEGVSLLENAGHLGLPIPEKIKTVLEQLHDRSESEGN